MMRQTGIVSAERGPKCRQQRIVVDRVDVGRIDGDQRTGEVERLLRAVQQDRPDLVEVEMVDVAGMPLTRVRTRGISLHQRRAVGNAVDLERLEWIARLESREPH